MPLPDRVDLGMAELIALLCGMATALLTWWWAQRSRHQPPNTVSTLPWPWSVCWFAIDGAARHLPAHWWQRGSQACARSLQMAGLDPALSVAHFRSGQVVFSVLLMLLYLLVQLLSSGFDHALPLWWGLVPALLIGTLLPVYWRRTCVAQRQTDALKTLPFYLDLLTLCLEAGLNIQGAMSQAVNKGPDGVLRREWQRVLRDTRAGKPRSDALRDLSDRLGLPAMTSLCVAIIQAESTGMNLGPVLRAQASQRRTERFQRAEKLAMEAPVKMLFPLIAFIFPCTFAVLFFPFAIKFMSLGG